MRSTDAEPPVRIPLRGGDEHDVFSQRSRGIHCWTQRAGACRAAKRTYARRLRHIAKRILAEHVPADELAGW